MSAEEVIAQEVWQRYVVEVGRAMPEGLADKLAADVIPALREAGFAVVELPKPLEGRGSMWPLVLGGETEFVSVPANGFSGDPIALSGVGGLTADEARYLAATLLAAAEASA